MKTPGQHEIGDAVTIRGRVGHVLVVEVQGVPFQRVTARRLLVQYDDGTDEWIDESALGEPS